MILINFNKMKNTLIFPSTPLKRLLVFGKSAWNDQTTEKFQYTTYI